MQDNSFKNIAKTQLFAKIAMADGKPSQTIDASAFAIIEMLDSNELIFLKNIYKKATTELQLIDIAELISILGPISNSEKAELLRGCCYLATCEDKITDRKQAMISEIGTLLGFTKSDIELAQKSVG